GAKADYDRKQKRGSERAPRKQDDTAGRVGGGPRPAHGEPQREVSHERIDNPTDDVAQPLQGFEPRLGGGVPGGGLRALSTGGGVCRDTRETPGRLPRPVAVS